MLIRTHFSLVICLLLVIQFNANAQVGNWKVQPNAIYTRWAKAVSPDNALPDYPRPQMVREKWINLNGLWEYAITHKDSQSPDRYNGQILVPYPLESSLSGVKRILQPTENLWYKRSFAKPKLKSGERVLLHFGAVDWQATVYINGSEMTTHSGGYQSFTLDVTARLKDGDNDLVVKVFDPSDRGIGAHGKQVLTPGNIYYTPSSGIWQTVWLEIVPTDFISDLVITPDVDASVLNVHVNMPTGCEVIVTALNGKSKVAQATGQTENVTLHIANAKLWSPENPYLYDLNVRLVKGGKTIDEVKSYFGMRKIGIQKDEKGIERIFLNNKPYFNLGTLDQGFWPDGLYTAPTDEALKFDIESIKAMGFNTIRKHIKVEPARWYYHADKIGILVWQDFVNPNQRLPEGAKEEYERETGETLRQLHNNPSIVTWVIFNEKWGAYDQQRITEWIKKSDPSRIVNGHSGELLYVNNELRSPSPNAYVSSDMTDVHSYPFPRMAPEMQGKARVLGEFGGIGVPVEGHLWDDLTAGWGYDGIATPVKLRMQYSQMCDSLVLLKSEGLSASIYTQPFDVESEQNGLLTYDRSIIKLPVSEIRALNLKVLGEFTQVQSGGYKIAAEVADSIPMSYGDKVALYNQGKKDSAFLRGVAIAAFAQKDSALCSRVTNEYLKSVTNIFSEINLKLICATTLHVKDDGFDVIVNNRDKIDNVLGRNMAEMTAMRLIEHDVILPEFSKKDLDLDKLESDVRSKYGELGEEKIYCIRLLYHLDKGQWNEFGKYYKLYFEGVLKHGRNLLHINNVTWPVFENVTDTSVLNTAVRVMKYDLDVFDSDNPFSIDTYANLLYKVGQKAEALNWQRKALDISNNDATFKNSYDKMMRGEKTWK